jgi:hypothetical protein
MRGKYVSTMLWLAALSSNGNNKSKVINVKRETVASMQDHEVIWNKQDVNEIKSESLKE